MISLKQIVYALAVEQTRHFKKAAEICAVSQSALSTAIAELESQLGMQVFERDTKKVLVTPLGEQFLARAREIKLAVDDLTLLARSQKTPLSHPMTLGVIPTIGPWLLPLVLPLVRRTHPDFELRIVEEQSPVLVDKVRRGELDTAILALPYDIEGLHAFEFWQEDFHLLTHRSHALAALPRVTAEDIQRTPLLLLKDGHCLKEHALAACHLRAAPARRTLEGTSLHTLVQMVAGKLGSTLVPAMALPALMAGNSELVSVPLDEPGPHRRLAFITRLNYAGGANIDALIGLFRQALAGNQNAST